MVIVTLFAGLTYRVLDDGDSLFLSLTNRSHSILKEMPRHQEDACHGNKVAPKLCMNVEMGACFLMQQVHFTWNDGMISELCFNCQYKVAWQDVLLLLCAGTPSVTNGMLEESKFKSNGLCSRAQASVPLLKSGMAPWANTCSHVVYFCTTLQSFTHILSISFSEKKRDINHHRDAADVV